MADKLITQTELDTYLSSIDLTETETNRVLNAIQLLTTRNYNTILFYLVNSTISLQDLFLLPINNASIEKFIAGVENQNLTNVGKLEYYESFLSSLSAYKTYRSNIASQSSQFVFLFSYPSAKVAYEVSLDTSGLDSTKFSNVLDAKNKYLSILDTLETSAAKQELNNACLANGYSNLLSIINKELRAYCLLYSSDFSIPLSVDTTTITGYCARQLFLFPGRLNFLNTHEYIKSKMVERYSTDALKNGVPGLNLAMTNCPIIYLNEITTNSLFLSYANEVYNIHYSYPSIYGSPFFSPVLVNNNKQVLDVLFGLEGIFSKCFKFVSIFFSSLQNEMKP